ncbi:hypothetical protein ACHAXS_011972 [Conticribra weissflogii]
MRTQPIETQQSENRAKRSIAQVFHELNPSMKLICLSSIASSIALAIFGICTLTSGVVSGRKSYLNDFGADTSNSVQEKGDDPTFSPSVTVTISSTVAAPFSKLSSIPTGHPTQTSMPSYSPILQSYAPTNSVTLRPSYEPSVMLFHNPSTAPSTWTTITPSSTPTYEPNAVLSTMPSQQPSERAIEAPLSDPTSNPTKPSSSTPTFYPTTSTSQSPTKMTDRSTTSQPTMHPHPTLSGFPSQEPEFQPHSEPQNPNPTYFNYNPASILGPNQWGNITALNSTDNYWFEFGFVENRCNADDQSPIDVCTKPTRDCKEHHEFRTRVKTYHIAFHFVIFVVSRQSVFLSCFVCTSLLS